MRLFGHFAILVIGFSLSFKSLAASFNCGKASTSVEKSICANSQLSALDDQLMQAYKNALSNTQVPNELKNAQRAWLNSQRNKCNIDINCLQQVYTTRINKLVTLKAQSKPDRIPVKTNTGQPTQTLGSEEWEGDPHKCDDGTKFTINYIAQNEEGTPSKARLTIGKKKIEEILECKMYGANAIDCFSENYGYNNFKGEVSLNDHNKGFTCHEAW